MIGARPPCLRQHHSPGGTARRTHALPLEEKGREGGGKEGGRGGIQSHMEPNWDGSGRGKGEGPKPPPPRPPQKSATCNTP